MSAEDVRRNLRIIFGEHEEAWTMHAALPTEDEGGGIVVQFPEGTDQNAVLELHRHLTELLEALIAE